MDVSGNVFDDILKKLELDRIDYNISIYNLILEEFLSCVDVDFEFLDCESAMDKVLGLKDNYIYTSDYVELFFNILAKYNYYMGKEIKDAMFGLGHLRNHNRNKELIHKLLASPVIDDISFDGKSKFVINSCQYGEFVFYLASYWFRRNRGVIKYMKKTPLPKHCHSHTFFLSQVFEKCFSITSLCRSEFGGTYYHSYTYDKDSDNIIDLCYNGIVNKDLYYKLFQPQDISVILNSKVPTELFLTNLKTEQPTDRCELLRIALYKQYLDSIGYKGDFENAPYVKKKANIK